MQCKCCGPDSEFSMEAAMALFKDVFGEDVREALSRLGGAAGQVARAARVEIGEAATMLGCSFSVAGEVVGVVSQAAGEIVSRSASGLQYRLSALCCQRRKQKGD